MDESSNGENRMDREELKNFILRRLGSPLWKIYLTSDHLEDAVSEAMHWFAAKKGVLATKLFPLYSGQVEYALPNDVDTVIDVVFPVPPMDISLIWSPFILVDEKVPYDVFAAPASAGIYSSFVQSLQYIETAKRILGAETEWLQKGRLLYILPVPKLSGNMLVEFKSSNVVLEQLNERDHDLVKRYAVAFAKKDLGTVLSRIDSYPAAQGSVTLDGSRLLDAAAEELQNLEEEIALSGFPLSFITG